MRLVAVEKSRHFRTDEFRAKYREERDKRLRQDGNDQYIKIAGSYAHFQDDPYTPFRPRDALQDEVEVLVVGGGFSGLLVAVRLREAGIDNVRIVERGGDFGGTWYWNRYPGAQCDVESYIYMPLLEEVGYVPKQKFSNASEIFAHCRAIGKHCGLYENACFHTLVSGLRWDDGSCRWIITTDRRDRIRARFICLADGPLSQPKLPGIENIGAFRGKMFHTSRWDYAYTGGGPDGKLVELADKRVGIIGTGATSVQCVPHLAESCGHLYVFQRTPSSVFPRDNKATESSWAGTLMPGWQWARMTNFNRVISGLDVDDRVDDGLTRLHRKLSSLPRTDLDKELSADEMERRSELLDLEQMEEVRSRIDRIVADPVTAAALKPWYRLNCKRPCFNDAYLQSFNRPNVTLVDTAGKGVTRLTETAVVAADRTYDVDCLIFATGFEVGTAYPARSGFEVFGRSGLTLTEKWAGGLRTLHGLQTHGFPNCFFLGITQGAYTANFSHMLYEQSTHIAYIVSAIDKRGKQAVEVTEEAEDAWVDVIKSFGTRRSDFSRDCTPGYYNNEGKLDEAKSTRIPSFYGGSSETFFGLLKAWRVEGDLKGLHLFDPRPGGPDLSG